MNNHKNTPENTQKSPGLVPLLRFPEFKDAGEWKNELFEEIYSFNTTNSLSRDKLNYENGTVKNIHYGDIHTKFPTLFHLEKESVPFINTTEPLEKIKTESYCVEGDMIFADASEDMDDVGKSIEIVSLNNQKLVSGLHTLLARQIKPKLIIGFGGYLFKSKYIRDQIQKESQGAKVLGISARRLAGIEVTYPANEKEQKKIADCLYSLDELITAENQKLDTLKDHKKGLMQQLFPVEGQTTPKYRFSDFKNSGDWEQVTLEQVAEYENGKAHEQNIDDQGKYIVVNSKFISTEGDVKKYTNIANLLAQKDEVLMVLSDVPNGRAIAKCFYVDQNDVYTVNQRICKLTAKKNVVSLLLFYILNRNSYFLDFDDGIKQTNLKKDDVLSCPVLLPNDKNEQQKIVDCLSSIDDLITSQTQKIESLKAHKKGLMQQLFPSVIGEHL